jgi:hypothetical protein
VISRRGFLRGVGAGVTVGVGVGVGGAPAAGCSGRGDQRELRIAAGEPGGLYLEFAQLLAVELAAEAPWLRAAPVATEGSRENLNRLADGSVEVALALADTVGDVVLHDGARGDGARLTSIGRVYENYLQLVVLADSPIRGPADLAGRTFSTGAAGSGADFTVRRLLTVTGLLPGSPSATGAGSGPAGAITLRHHRLVDAIAALETGGIDALAWSGGVPTPALAALAHRRPIRLISLAEALPALRAAYDTGYDAVSVPSDAYGSTTDVITVGVANLLVCRANTDPSVTEAVARTLVTRAARLVPGQALGTQFLDPRSLIVTDKVPLHPGAAAAYRDLHG